MELPAEYLRGIELFNAGQFFECHEVWEEIWLKAEGVERAFLHALIQSAVALLHFQRGNLRGAQSVYERARRKLEQLPRLTMHLDTHIFTQQLDHFFSAALIAEHPIPSFPKIRLQN
jgi:predicted metal-dependent hydrolase